MKRVFAALAVGAMMLLAACARVTGGTSPVQGGGSWKECCFELLPYTPEGVPGEKEKWTLPIDPPEPREFSRPWARLGRTEASG